MEDKHATQTSIPIPPTTEVTQTTQVPDINESSTTFQVLQTKIINIIFSMKIIFLIIEDV